MGYISRGLDPPAAHPLWLVWVGALLRSHIGGSCSVSGFIPLYVCRVSSAIDMKNTKLNREEQEKEKGRGEKKGNEQEELQYIGSIAVAWTVVVLVCRTILRIVPLFVSLWTSKTSKMNENHYEKEIRRKERESKKGSSGLNCRSGAR